MTKYKLGEFLFNGEVFGVIIDIVLGSGAPYRVRWFYDDQLSAAYVEGHINMYKEIYEIEVCK